MNPMLNVPSAWSTRSTDYNRRYRLTFRQITKRHLNFGQNTKLRPHLYKYEVLVQVQVADQAL